MTKKKKRTNNSKKGGNFERLFCKALSEWYSKSMCDEIRDDIFWRTSGSGARATTRMKSGISTINSVGDVAALDPCAAPFMNLVNIEIKRGYTGKSKNSSMEIISILNMIDRPRVVNPEKLKKLRKLPLLIRWIKKAKMESRKHKIENPIVVFRRDRKVSCIVLQDYTFKMLEQNFRQFVCPHDGPISHVSFQRYFLTIMRLEDFFAWCPAKAFFEKIPTVKRPRYKVGKYRGMNIINWPKGFM